MLSVLQMHETVRQWLNGLNGRTPVMDSSAQGSLALTLPSTVELAISISIISDALPGLGTLAKVCSLVVTQSFGCSL